MKSKSRPIKRKLSQSLSTECAERDVFKKYRPTPSDTLLDVNTTRINNDCLQVSPKAHSSTHCLDDVEDYRNKGLSHNHHPAVEAFGTNVGSAVRNNKCKAAPSHNHCPIAEAFGTNMGSAIRNNKSEAASYMEADIVDPYTPIVCRKVIYQHNANAKKGKDHVP
ncbi:hypothetical protein Tco_1230985 [Tanacetum coccineum]